MSVVFLAAPLAAWALAVYLCVCALSGVFIGATGIGGVLLVPCLLLLGVDVTVAMPVAVGSQFFSGAVAVISNRRVLPLKPTVIVGLTSIPGAIGGAFLFPLVPAVVSGAFIALIAIVSGVRAVRAAAKTLGWLRCASRDDGGGCGKDGQPSESHAAADDVKLSIVETKQSPTLPARFAALLGAPVGFLSVLTSTGGPFIAVPLLFHFYPRLPPAFVVALVQARAGTEPPPCYTRRRSAS